MRLRAFKKFAPFVRYVKDWTEIADVDKEQIDFGAKSWAHWCTKWLDLIETTGRYISVDGVVQPLSGLRADEYVASDRLDLEHLSPPVQPVAA